MACAEFAINNSWQETEKNTPFFLNYGQHPLTPATKQLPSTVPKAADFAEGIVKSVKEARKCMEAAQQKMKARADKHRREVVYSPGDMVMLSMKNMRHGGPGVKKLRPLFMGPFEVDHMVGASAVKLHLPPEWRRIHNVFHVSLTKPFLSDPAKPHRAVTPPPPVQWLDGEPLYRVECLLEHMVAKRGRKKFYRFLVKWDGYEEEHNTWEPEWNLLGCDDLESRSIKLRD